jgi:hypothetical protein
MSVKNLVKERPILFTGQMVRAILNQKTQTRRAIDLKCFDRSDTPGYDWHWRCKRGLWQDYRHEKFLETCPYGKVGDRLWVRETCKAEELPSGLDGVRYAADNSFREIENSQDASYKWSDLYAYGKGRGKNVPSIHMPRWAARITLEVTGVRVERLNEISNEDCAAEGITAIGKGVRLSDGSYAQAGRYEHKSSTVRQLYSELWESINGPGSWAANPWVWVVEFRKEPSK